jgi:hypothetical protein
MSNSHNQTDFGNNINNDHVYEIISNMEMVTFNDGQGGSSRSHANSVYARAPTFGQSDDYVYIHRENNDKKYISIFKRLRVRFLIEIL